MHDSTPTPRPNNADDGDQFRITIDRPTGMSSEAWKRAKQQISAGVAPVVGDSLGQCVERPWCCLAGHEDHADFHTSHDVDLVPSDQPGEHALVTVWLSENRRSETGPGLCFDASGRFEPLPRMNGDVDPADAALVATLLAAAPAGAARRLLDLLSQLDDEDVAEVTGR